MIQSNEASDSDDDSLSVNHSEYDFSDYTPIISFEQRHKYKTEYDNDDIEFREIGAIFEEAIRRFAILRKEIIQNRQDLRDANEDIRCDAAASVIQIRKEFDEIINKEFQFKKQRFFYLDEKLSHIQKLISDFDNIFKNRRSMREANASLIYWLSLPNNE